MTGERVRSAPGAAAIGALAGGLAGLVLTALMVADGVDRIALLSIGPTAARVLLHLVAAVAIGATTGIVFRRDDGATAAVATGGLLVGLLWWVFGPLTIAQLLQGERPFWSLAEATAAFPNLVSALLAGGLAGTVHAALLPRVGGIPGLRRITELPTDQPVHVVVLGGGFGGVATAQRLEQLVLDGADVTVSLVSPNNSLLFTPMLAEVAGSALQPHHISAPIRATCPRTRFYRGEVVDIDLARQAVGLTGSSITTLHYDHLVLALGSVPNYRDLPGMAEHSFTMKSLHDAVSVRNHVIAMLERADTEIDPVERRKQLTFVVAGGGFAGTETIAELFDLVHNARRYYPHVRPEELRFVLVHSRDHILPEIGRELGDYALEKLRRRGIEFHLETRVAGASADAMLLAGGEAIPCRTLVWTAGNQPHPALRALDVDKNRAGAVVVDETLRSLSHSNLWGVGDCAQIPDPLTDGFHPPTAQHALREGKALADNVAAVVAGHPPKPFRFKAIGILVALGHRTAVAEIRGLRFSGLLAWMLWRGVYLSKLPGLEKKLRVLIDWTIDLLFPRDIVLAVDSDTRPTAPPGPPPQHRRRIDDRSDVA